MSVATPVVAYVASIEAGKALPQTGTYTFNIAIPAAWEIKLPIEVMAPNTANNSSGPLIFVFRSSDGGTVFDTVALQSVGLTRPTAAQKQQFSMKLETGNYLVCVVMGGGQASTWSIRVLTQQILTGILNA